ncbi:probable E3 ubiquitin-protein ligase MID2 [Mytilus trossulus]|uniref:probable E3 ubiquitin-protein ligase MID2 n=1 Tax=Mytilus trossulus TaxID=6551 RepID=UPI003007DF2F
MAELENECDIFTCPICLETLKSPRSLPCLHSFCEICIGEFISSTERQSGHKLSSYPCPVCRSVVTPTDPGNDTSQWLLSLPQSKQMCQSERTEQECHMCKKQNKLNTATHWCRDCVEAFCKECLRLHNLMKFFADHKVVKIDDIKECASGSESDLRLISHSCPIHKSKIFEAFCFNHQKLCCVLCLTLQHRECETVHAIDEIYYLDKSDILSSLESELIKMKSKVYELKEARWFHKEQLDFIFTEIESNAKQHVLCLQQKLDSLLDVFIKKLNLTRDEERLSSEEKLEAVDNLSGYIEQLQNVSKTVQDQCNLNQTFIFFEQSKAELKSVVRDVKYVIIKTSVNNAEFTFSKTLDQISSVDSLGDIEFSTSNPIDGDEFTRQLYPSKSILLDKSRPPLCYNNISFKRNKTVSLKGFTIYGCVFVSETEVVLGGSEIYKDVLTGNIKTLDISTGNITSEYIIADIVKRLAYDFESASLFVSCDGSKFHYLKLVNDVRAHVNLERITKSVGGTCVFENNVYVIVEKIVKKVSIDTLENDVIPETCFKTDTVFTFLNGLEIDCKNKRLLYTSSDYEVVCSSLEGHKIFSYKDHNMESYCLAIFSQGEILIGDINGSVYLLSKDGKKKRTVIKKGKKVVPIWDICLNKYNTSSVICGPDFIEVYDIVSAKQKI